MNNKLLREELKRMSNLMSLRYWSNFDRTKETHDGISG